MLTCKNHGMGMMTMTHAIADCPKCKRGTGSTFKLCAGCAVRARRCGICLEPAEEKLGRRFIQQVEATERRYDRALASAQAELDKAFAPFAEIAASFEATRAATDAEHNAAVRALTEELDQAQHAHDMMNMIEGSASESINNDYSQLPDLFTLRQRYQPTLDELHAKRDQKMAPVIEALKPHRETYQLAMVAYHSARQRAVAIADIKYGQIFGHLKVDRDYARMMERFAS